MGVSIGVVETGPHGTLWRRLFCRHKECVRYEVSSTQTVCGCTGDQEIRLVVCCVCGRVLSWEFHDLWDPCKPSGMDALREAAERSAT